MAQFLIILYGEEAAWESASPEEQQAVMDGHRAFGEKYQDMMLGSNALQPSPTGKSVRPDGHGFSITDGPFVETKEAVGGYYLVDAPDAAAAVELAKQIPALPGGGAEVRAIRVLD